MRFGLQTYAEPSTRSGRRYARVAPDHALVGVEAIDGSETILAITADCRAMVCPAWRSIISQGRQGRNVNQDSQNRSLDWFQSLGRRP